MSFDFSKMPALPPPPGVVPNFVNPETRGRVLIVTSAICLTLMYPIVIIRFYSRLWISRSFRGDDAACLLAVVGSTAYTAVALTSLNVIGPHMWNVPVLAMGPEFLRKLVIGLGLIYPPTAFFAKLSLFLLYLHIFSPNRPTRYMIYSGIAITFGLYTATFAYNVYLCVPRPGQGWLVAVSSPRCNKAYILSYIQGPFGIVSDFYLLLLPVPVVWQLHLPAKRKIGVCAIFATGFLACFSSVLGLYYRVRVVRSTDFSWQMLPVITLVIVEINVGVICSCMPHLASFFRHHHTYLTFFRSLTSRLFSSIKSSKRSFFSSHKSSPDESFDHVDARPSSDQSPYLETQILKSSARGDGRFLESGEFPLPPGQSHYRWSGGAPEPPEMRQGEPTYRDIWDRRV